MSDGTSRRIDDIEVLRAVAVLMVLFQHLPNLFPWTMPLLQHIKIYFGFWSGVDIFFVISGFVIARSLLPTLDAYGDRATYYRATVSFWIRRFWRLAPSAWFWLFLSMLLALAFNRSGAFGPFNANFQGAVAGILQVANFRFVEVFGRYPSGATFHYWTLSLEEQFYLLLPFLIFFSGRRLPLVLAVIVLAQFFIPRMGPEAIGFMQISMLRSDGLALGVLIALWTRHESYRLVEPRLLAGNRLARIATFSLLLFLIAAVSSDRSHIAFFAQGLIALLSAILVLIASYDRDYLWKDGIAKRIMLWIGSRSYALYLIHIPAYFAAREIWFRIEPMPAEYDMNYALKLGGTAALILVALAELNYRLIETPLRKRGKHIAQAFGSRQIPAPA